MMKLFIPILLISFFSCRGENKPVEKSEVFMEFKGEKSMEKQRNDIDLKLSAVGGLEAQSLNFNNDIGEYIKVVAHYDTSNTLVKIEEFFSEGPNKDMGMRAFYFTNNKPFMTYEELTVFRNGNQEYLERKSFYDKKGKVLKTNERIGQVEDIESKAFQSVSPIGFTTKRALDCLNNKGRYDLCFLGVFDVGPDSFIQLGENKLDDPSGFHTELKLNFRDATIMELMSDQQSYLGKKIACKFEVIQDEDQKTYQVYLGGAIVN